MNNLDYKHRLAKCVGNPDFFRMDFNFSIFDFFQSRGFPTQSPLHRCFSIARSAGVYGFFLEELEGAGEGIVREEFEWLRAKYPKFECSRFVRISFWKKAGSCLWFKKLVPYGIVLFRIDAPQDGIHEPVPYVYEAVFPKYAHRHNCVHSETGHVYLVCGKRYAFYGSLFAQQNGLSKCCAHVAIYSLLEGREDVSGEISFAMMNSVVFGGDCTKVDIAGRGLLPAEIEKILNHYGVNFKSLQYETASEEFCREHDYVASIYAGAESGQGALLGFDLDDGQKQVHRIAESSLGHIIPVYGHTFNKDTWVPDANRKYFSPDKVLGYIPSLQWMSSFIAHDDNVGANLCIPRWFIRQSSVKYAVELLPKGVLNSSVEVEGCALQMLYSIVGTTTIVNRLTDQSWFKRLCEAVDAGTVVLRTQTVELSEYAVHLREHASVRQDMMEEIFSGEGVYWLVEVSVRQLFPANEMKIADLLFNATKPIDIDAMTNFALARVPGGWIFPVNTNELLCHPSGITGPLPNFVRLPERGEDTKGMVRFVWK